MKTIENEQFLGRLRGRRLFLIAGALIAAVTVVGYLLLTAGGAASAPYAAVAEGMSSAGSSAGHGNGTAASGTTGSGGGSGSTGTGTGAGAGSTGSGAGSTATGSDGGAGMGSTGVGSDSRSATGLAVQANVDGSGVYTGPCEGGATIGFQAQVSVTRGPLAAQVTWLFDGGRSDGGHVTFADAGPAHTTISTSYSVAAPSRTGWAQAEITVDDGPAVTSNRVAYRVVCTTPTLTLSRAVASESDPLSATATGLTPGESVNFTWAGGSASGRLGSAATADANGKATVTVPVLSIGPGHYTVTAHAASSSASPTAPLTVTGTPRLALTNASVADGATYTATATGFLPHESVSFTWSGPTPGAWGTFADASGNATMTVVDEEAAPGSYTMSARGAISGGTPTATLLVVS
jgi:hypothetical protein